MTDPTNETRAEQEPPELTEEELDLLYQFSYPINGGFTYIENIEMLKLPPKEAAKRMKQLFKDTYRGTEKAIHDMGDKTGPHYARLKQALIGSNEELIKIIGLLSEFQRSRNLEDPQDLKEFKQKARNLHSLILPYMKQVGSNPLFKALRVNTTAKDSSRPKRVASDYLK